MQVGSPCMGSSARPSGCWADHLTGLLLEGFCLGSLPWFLPAHPTARNLGIYPKPGLLPAHPTARKLGIYPKPGLLPAHSTTRTWAPACPSDCPKPGHLSETWAPACPSEQPLIHPMLGSACPCIRPLLPGIALLCLASYVVRYCFFYSGKQLMRRQGSRALLAGGLKISLMHTSLIPVRTRTLLIASHPNG